MEQGRELALLLDDGTVIRDAGWRSVADVHASFIGFVGRGGRTYGVIVDAETLEQVYPPKPMDGTGGTKD